MPRTQPKNVSKYYRKKRMRRRRRKYTRIPRNFVVPDRKLVRMRYVDAVNLNPAAGAANSNVYAANDLFDPDVSGVGHQPLGFDQWMAFYDHFTVLGSKCIVRAWNGTAASPAVAFINLNDNSSISATLSTIAELNNTTRKPLALSAAGGSIQTILSRSFSAKRFFGNRNPMADDEQSGSASSSPTERAYYIVGCYPLDHAADLGNITVEVEIQYTAMFHERKDLTQS